jgi:hypothetical protein
MVGCIRNGLVGCGESVSTRCSRLFRGGAGRKPVIAERCRRKGGEGSKVGEQVQHIQVHGNAVSLPNLTTIHRRVLVL